jgi:hypothetical protein
LITYFKHLLSSIAEMRILLLATILLLTSCNKQSHWSNDQVHSRQQESRSAKLYYRSPDPVHGIDLEFLQTQEHLKVYLNVHSIPVPAHEGNPKSAQVNLLINSEPMRCVAYRLEGGQRFLLPDEIAEMLIKALKNNQEVSISLTGYRSIVKAEDFSAKFDRLLHPFRLQNPFHLPL